ncbi:hypothetical protein ACQHIV_29060 [Kribbella sp. GL6]|uniref:hypothetical protein n=1 Tax=Kribbella sp. GL6 TaxID=3419765 RepID=UPI003D03F2F2
MTSQLHRSVRRVAGVAVFAGGVIALGAGAAQADTGRSTQPDPASGVLQTVGGILGDTLNGNSGRSIAPGEPHPAERPAVTGTVGVQGNGDDHSITVGTRQRPTVQSSRTPRHIAVDAPAKADGSGPPKGDSGRPTHLKTDTPARTDGSTPRSNGKSRAAKQAALKSSAKPSGERSVKPLVERSVKQDQGRGSGTTGTSDGLLGGRSGRTAPTYRIPVDTRHAVRTGGLLDGRRVATNGVPNPAKGLTGDIPSTGSIPTPADAAGLLGGLPANTNTLGAVGTPQQAANAITGQGSPLNTATTAVGNGGSPLSAATGAVGRGGSPLNAAAGAVGNGSSPLNAATGAVGRGGSPLGTATGVLGGAGPMNAVNGATSGGPGRIVGTVTGGPSSIAGSAAGGRTPLGTTGAPIHNTPAGSATGGTPTARQSCGTPSGAPGTCEYRYATDQSSSSQQTSTAVSTQQQNGSGSSAGSPLWVTTQDYGTSAGDTNNRGSYDASAGSQQTSTAVSTQQQNASGSSAGSPLWVTTQDYGTSAGNTNARTTGRGGYDSSVGSQQTSTAVSTQQQNGCGSSAGSPLWVTTQDYGTCAGEQSTTGNSRSGYDSSVGSQQTSTAVSTQQQNGCGSSAGSPLWVTTQDYGTCAGEARGTTGGNAGRGGYDSSVGSQQTSTAVSTQQQNGCGSSAGSPLWVTSQDYGTCAGETSGATGSAGHGAYDSSVGSQQTSTAVSTQQQNGCGSSAGSPLWVTSQDYGTCAGESNGSTGAGRGGYDSSVGSQQTSTAVSTQQQNGCGSSAGSPLWVTSQDYGTCAGEANGSGGAGNGTARGGYDSSVGSQQTSTAVSTQQQNGCGSSAGSPLWVTTQDYGTCAGEANGAAGGNAGRGRYDSSVGSQQTSTAVSTQQQNGCGSSAGSPLWVTSQDYGTCAGETNSPAGAGRGGYDSSVGSQQTSTAVSTQQQNGCGSSAGSPLWVTSQDYGTCAGETNSPAGAGRGGYDSSVGSQQTSTAVSTQQQNGCGSSAGSPLWVTSQDYGTCAGETNSPAGAGRGGYDSSVGSQQTSTAVSTQQQNGCGSSAGSPLWVTSQDYGTCAGEYGSGTAGGDTGGTPAGAAVGSQQTSTAVSTQQQNACGSSAGSPLWVTTQDYGTCADAHGNGTAGGDTGGTPGAGTASQQTATPLFMSQQNACGSQSGSLLWTTSQDYGTCSAADANSGEVPSQQTSTLVGGMQQNACGSTMYTPLWVSTQDYGTCGSTTPNQPGNPGKGTVTTGTPTINGKPAAQKPGPNVKPGDKTTVSIPVSNTGKDPVNNLQGTSSTGTMTCGKSTLKPGESTTCTTTYTAKPGDQGVQYAVTGTSGSTPVSATGTVYYHAQQPGKVTTGTPTINGKPAGQKPGPRLDPGKPATVTVPVSNTGDTQVTNLKGTSSSGQMSCGKSALKPGESTTCTLTTTSTPGNQGIQYAVTGDSGSTPIATTGTVYYQGKKPTAGTVTPGTPTINGKPAGQKPGPNVKPGDKTTVSVPVSNTGGTTVNGLTATTPRGAMTCGKTSLQPGESTTCSMSTTAGQGSQNIPYVVNGTSGTTPVTATGTAHYQGKKPAPGKLTTGTPTINGKPANHKPGPNVKPGDKTTVTVPVSNSGDTPVDNLHGTSSNGTLKCGATSLQPGQSTTCSTTYTAKPGDQGIQYAVNGTSGSTPVSTTGTVYYQGKKPTPGKLTTGTPTINGTQADHKPGPNVKPGDRTTVTVPVTNSGGTEVAGLKGSTQHGQMTCSKSNLQPGESTTCTVSSTAGRGDQGVAYTVSGTSGTSPVSTTGTAYYRTPGKAGITVGRATVGGKPAGQRPGPAVRPGDRTTVSVPVTNTGETGVRNLAASTPQGRMACDKTSLKPGESTTCTMSTTAVQGNQQVPVKVTGIAGNAEPVASGTTAYYSTSKDRSAITVGRPVVNGKSASGRPGPRVTPGKPATVVVPVRNTGSTRVSNLTASTPGGRLACAKSTLRPGESTTCTATTTAQPGTHNATFTASATGPDGSTTSAATTAFYTGATTSNGTASGNKNQLVIGRPTVSGRTTDSGVLVPVTNTTNHRIDNLGGTSDRGRLVCKDRSLAAGQSTLCWLGTRAATGQQAVPVSITGVSATTGNGVVATGVVRFRGSTTALPSTKSQVTKKPVGPVRAGGGTGATTVDGWLLGIGLLTLFGAVLLTARRRPSES